jgi:hypothetical protein
MATYTITINMTDDTVRELQNLDFSLYGFKAVKASGNAASPLVWFATEGYSRRTTVEWKTAFQAYSSSSEIVPMGTVTARAVYGIDLGQTFIIESELGVGRVEREGTATAITISNKVRKRFTCGISQETDGAFAQVCAAPVIPGLRDIFIPVEKVLLFFATERYNPGTVITRAFGPGLLVDMTGAPNNRREVSFSVQERWTFSGTFAQPVRSRTDIVPLLVESSTIPVELPT